MVDIYRTAKQGVTIINIEVTNCFRIHQTQSNVLDFIGQYTEKWSGVLLKDRFCLFGGSKVNNTF